MTPDEHDIPKTSEEPELKTTELYPFVTGYPQGADREMDDTLPDVPAMEQLPDPDALPDPGYPEMPATAQDYATGVVEPPADAWDVDEEAGQPCQRPRGGTPAVEQEQLKEPSEAAETPRQVWS